MKRNKKNPIKINNLEFQYIIQRNYWKRKKMFERLTSQILEIKKLNIEVRSKFGTIRSQDWRKYINI